MRILQLCFRLPYPLKDGGAIAMYNMTKAFHDLGNNTTILAPVTTKHSVKDDEMPGSFKKLATIYTVPIKTDITFLGALMNLFTKKSYYISRYESRNFENKLIEILKNNEFDIVQVESLKVSMYLNTIRKYSDAKVVLRSHNIEYKIWERMAQTTKPGIKKWYLNILSKRLKKYELNCLNNFDAIVPITEVDAEFFRNAGCIVPIYTTPSGIDIKDFKVNVDKPEENSLFHLGSLDWLPNIEALNWFLSDIWLLISKEYPELKFYIAGRNAPESIMKINMENVFVLGEIEDAIEFMNTKSIMIVPLLSGSGMRIKIVEGMALGKIVISTSIGAEGINYTENENILIANTPEEFLEAVQKIKNNRDFAENIRKNAVKLIESEYDNKTIVRNLLNNYERLALEQ